MRHLHRLLLPAAAVLATAFSPAALANNGKDTSGHTAGRPAYDKQCLRCHTVPQALDFLRKHPDDAERAKWLDAKLARHHARDAKARAAIIAFLERELATGSGKKNGK